MAKGKKTGGRNKGTPNQLTHQFRSKMVAILDAYTDGALFTDFMMASAGERLAFISKMIAHVIPKAESESVKPADFLGTLPASTVKQEFEAQREMDSILNGVMANSESDAETEPADFSGKVADVTSRIKEKRSLKAVLGETEVPRKASKVE